MRRKLWIWTHLLKKSLIGNFIFCAVYLESIMGDIRKTVGEMTQLVQSFLRYTPYREGASGNPGPKIKSKKNKLKYEKNSQVKSYVDFE